MLFLFLREHHLPLHYGLLHLRGHVNGVHQEKIAVKFSKVDQNREWGKMDLYPNCSKVSLFKIIILVMGKLKTGGRQSGTPNRLTAERRKLLDLFLEDNFEEFQRRMLAIDNPVDFCRLYISILGFDIPKLSSVSVKDDIPKKTLRDELDEIAGL